MLLEFDTWLEIISEARGEKWHPDIFSNIMFCKCNHVKLHEMLELFFLDVTILSGIIIWSNSCALLVWEAYTN